MEVHRRPGTVDRLPEPVRERIGELRRAGRTIDEIMDALAALAAPPVSRSALGRYTKRIDAVGRSIRESREVAVALVDRYGAEPENRQARLNMELLHGLVMRLIVSDDGPVELSPQEASALSAAVRNLVMAGRHDVEREKALRAHLAEKAGDAARQAGVTGDTVAAIRAAVERIES